MLYNRATVVNLLKEGNVEIKFTKVDGTTRVLNGTLNVDDVEVVANPTAANTLSVLDTDINEWRQFRWDSVKTINGSPVSL